MEELRGHLDWLDKKMEAIRNRQITSNNVNNNNNSNVNSNDAIAMEGSSSSLRGVIVPSEPIPVDDANTIVCGDFNEGSLGGGYEYMQDRHFFNALNLSDEKNTWYWPLPLGFNMWGSYDHIFCHSKSFLVEKCVVMKDYIHVSDHVPVMATISGRPPSEANEKLETKKSASAKSLNKTNSSSSSFSSSSRKNNPNDREVI
jgi:endonuclease/exonuclease/phosphatase family metal-dependent hydrolase